MLKFTFKSTWLGLRNSRTRIPFRYGHACLTRCPQAVLEATIEAAGRVVRGYSGDCLPPGWFDKRAGLSYENQIDDLLAVIGLAQRLFAEEASTPITFFDAWLPAWLRHRVTADSLDYPALVSSFGMSLVERAVMDAICRAEGLGLSAAVRENLFEIRAGDVHVELAGLQPRDWLPAQPSQQVFVRQTVGLGDALSEDDILPEDKVDDGFPQAVRDYMTACGVRYFKFKLSNQPQHDLARLERFALLIEDHRGDDYFVTLDGNEQYPRAEDFDAFMAMVAATPRLQNLLSRTLAIEQPLARDIALDPAHTAGIRRISQRLPVIIDESDSSLDSFAAALDLGYRGVSSKNCKGAIKSLLNAGLAFVKNGRRPVSDPAANYIMTAEDLCSVGVIPVQSDLCLAATLGLTHVERNGHHYHPGLDYLPPGVQQQALAAHADFYHARLGRVVPAIRDGKLHLQSLHAPGCGFSVLPSRDDYQPADAWTYASL